MASVEIAKANATSCGNRPVAARATALIRVPGNNRNAATAREDD
jgi:hypothetical protein